MKKVGVSLHVLGSWYWTYDGALEIIITQSHYGLLQIPLIRNLIEKKWNTFAKRAIMARCCIVSFYLLVFAFFSVQSKELWRLEAMRGSECVLTETRTCEDIVAPLLSDNAWIYLRFYSSLWRRSLCSNCRYLDRQICGS